MRISWLSAEEIASALQALTASGATYEDHFRPQFVAPPEPSASPLHDCGGVTEHLARAERRRKAGLGRPVDGYVFYAPFLELLVALGRGQIDRTVEVYEQFVAAYARALGEVPHGARRVGAVRDGLADFYVSAGRIDDAEELFERRH